MPFAFLDISALIKLYVPELGTNWVRNLAKTHQIVISELALFESVTVLRRRYLEGAFSRTQAIALFRRIRRISASYQIIDLGGRKSLKKLVNLVFSLAPSVRIRALDALHLETAQTAFDAANSLTPPEPFVFVSSDRQLLQVAQARGFVIENPEDYP